MAGKILVIANVEWIIALKQRNVDMSLVTFISPCAVKNGFVKYASPEVTIIERSLLEWETDMKFDVVIGNPPYTNGIWLDFFHLMCNYSIGIVCSINPDSSHNETSRGTKFKNFLIENGIQTKQDCTVSFPTVSTGKISYFICNKDFKGNTTVFNPDVIEHRIKNKVLAGKGKDALICRAIIKFTDIPTERLSDVKSNTHNIPLIISINKNRAEIKYTNISLKSFRNKYDSLFDKSAFVVNRFFGKNSPDPVLKIEKIQEYKFTDKLIIISAEQNETIENFNMVYQSILYKFMINVLASGQAIRDKQLMQLPRLDLSRTWSDAELYEHFGLTQEEIEYIENTVK